MAQVLGSPLYIYGANMIPESVHVCAQKMRNASVYAQLKIALSSHVTTILKSHWLKIFDICLSGHKILGKTRHLQASVGAACHSGLGNK